MGRSEAQQAMKMAESSGRTGKSSRSSSGKGVGVSRAGNCWLQSSLAGTAGPGLQSSWVGDTVEWALSSDWYSEGGRWNLQVLPHGWRVLVERTVKEVLPALENNQEQIQKITETLTQRFLAKWKELNEFREKQNMPLMGEDKTPAAKENSEGAGAEASPAAVLVS